MAVANKIQNEISNKDNFPYVVNVYKNVHYKKKHICIRSN